MDLKIIFLDKDAWPDSIEQFSLRYDAARIVEQDQQKVEGAAAQGHFSGWAPQLPLMPGQREMPEPDQTRLA
ncbi:MAG: hypothetical protein R3D05_21720 [Dongiaceae bacterium]